MKKADSKASNHVTVNPDPTVVRYLHLIQSKVTDDQWSTRKHAHASPTAHLTNTGSIFS